MDFISTYNIYGGALLVTRHDKQMNFKIGDRVKLKQEYFNNKSLQKINLCTQDLQENIVGKISRENGLAKKVFSKFTSYPNEKLYSVINKDWHYCFPFSMLEKYHD